ncbi:MAG: hypothetical protein KTR25_08315 [Myxococcales bacterium]|nr:hypothetical protein [Myxococcales bacterium]
MLFVVTFGVFLALTGLMSLGVLISGKRLQGSCGGVGTACACDAAGRPRACELEDSAVGQLSTSTASALASGEDPESLATLPSRSKMVS